MNAVREVSLSSSVGFTMPDFCPRILSKDPAHGCAGCLARSLVLCSPNCLSNEFAKLQQQCAIGWSDLSRL